MDQQADKSGLLFPRVFDILRTSKPPATILKELEKELNEDNSI